MKTRCNVKVHERKKKKLQLKKLDLQFYITKKCVCITLIWDFRQSAECFYNILVLDSIAFSRDG